MGSICRQGRAVMGALETGTRFRRDGGGWRGGGVKVPQAVIDTLLREDLVEASDNGLGLTMVGQGWSARTADPLSGNRLLATRVLPDDAAKPVARQRVVIANLAESPLGWLRSRGLVSERQFEAGERLRGDWTVAGLGPRVTMRWDDGPRGGGARGPDAPLDPTLSQIAAKQRTQAAMAAVGSGLSDILWRVVCDGEGMERAEKALGWPARAGRVVLCLALDRLADCYSLR